MASHRRLLGFVVFLALCGSPVHAQGESADERYGFVVGLCDEKEWELAVREARSFLAEFPGHAKAALARYRLATALFELGQREPAREEYAQLARVPSFEFATEVTFRLGQCELALAHPDLALKCFESVRAVEGHYLAAAAEYFCAEALFATGDSAGAEQRYLRVLADPRAAEYEREARYGSAWCAYRRGHFDEACARVDEFTRRFSGDALSAELLHLKGEAHLAAKRPREALAAFAQVREGTFVERALRGAAFATVELGDHGAAASAFGAMAARFPTGEFAAEARLQQGVEWLRAGDAARALEVLRACAATDIEAQCWLTRAQMSAQDALGALATVDAALALELKEEQAERLNVLRGDALTALGRSVDAVLAYSRAKSDYALYAAALAAYNDGRAQDAAQSAQALLEAFPSSLYACEMQLVVGEAALSAGELPRAEAAFRAAIASAADAGLHARALARCAWCRFMSDDAPAAEQLFRELLQKFREAPEADEARYMIGRCRDKQGDAGGAVRAWTLYLESAPQGTHAVDALSGLARLDAANATQWTRRIAEQFSNSPAAVAALLDAAERAAHAGRRDEALAVYRDVLARFSAHELAGQARYGLAWCLYEGGQHGDAARDLDLLVDTPQLAPELARSALELLVWARSKSKDAAGTVEAYGRFARCGAEPAKLLGAARLAGAALKDEGKPLEARVVYEDLLRASRDRDVQVSALIECAWLAIDAKDADEAEALVRTTWKLTPQAATQAALAEASFFVGELRFAAHDEARALALYELAELHGAPGLKAQALYKCGFTRLRNDEFDAAALCFARVASEHAAHELAGESRYLLGESHARAKHFDEAIEALAAFVAQMPRHASVPKALLRLGVAHGELGHWSQCEAALGELARRAVDGESNAEADVWRGRAAAQRKDARAAKAAFERVLAKDRGVCAARARIELGRLATAAHDDEEALAQFLKVALLYDGGEVVAEASYLAGEVLERLGRVDKAKARYRELVEKQPESAFATLARARLDALAR